AFAGIRGPLALPEPGREGGVLDLGGRFGLHPSLAKTHALYRAGQALIVHAVAGPYRVRSHFDAQDMLESGALQRLDSGWLNRALAGLPGSGGQPAGLAVGLDVPLLMKGPTPVRNYAPHGTLAVDEELMTRVQRLLSRDPTFGPVIARAQEERGFTAAVLRKEGEDGEMMGGAPVGRNSFGTLSGVAGRLMAAPNGPRVAALEQGGWDTHTSQVHRLTYALGQLDAGIAALREGLGDAWRHTAVLIVTEFGRTARANGTGGTDHGTAGAAFLVGGAVAGGKVRTDWPGLGQGKLFEDRDLAPTTDLRAVAKGLLRDHLKLPPAAVERAFPESGAVAPMAGLVRA
ncbi:MAG TPA: DUF1501 domain-containing protein, partial [Crenalkalicoccus sp.]|nr:DUF1501 domain-containing protein [Crenalkalicoccus sp.]